MLLLTCHTNPGCGIAKRGLTLVFRRLTGCWRTGSARCSGGFIPPQAQRCNGWWGAYNRLYIVSQQPARAAFARGNPTKGPSAWVIASPYDPVSHINKTISGAASWHPRDPCRHLNICNRMFPRGAHTWRIMVRRRSEEVGIKPEFAS